MVSVARSLIQLPMPQKPKATIRAANRTLARREPALERMACSMMRGAFVSAADDSEPRPSIAT